MTRDRDAKNIAHAVLGCAALFVLWPVNVLVAGLVGNARVRGVVSGLLLVCLGIAYVLGGLTSGEYNRVSFSTMIPGPFFSVRDHDTNINSPKHTTHRTKSSPSYLSSL